MRRLFVLGALLIASCASGDDVDAVDDPSKLSAELEARAAEIEKRADEAAAEVEKEAADELAELEADARKAEQDAAGDAVDTDSAAE